MKNEVHAALIAEAPYIVHHAGPDDVYEVDTWRAAVLLAHEINVSVVEYTARSSHDGLVRSWATPYVREDAVTKAVI